jgi:hypothetical protein
MTKLTGATAVLGSIGFLAFAQTASGMEASSARNRPILPLADASQKQSAAPVIRSAPLRLAIDDLLLIGQRYAQKYLETNTHLGPSLLKRARETAHDRCQIVSDGHAGLHGASIFVRESICDLVHHSICLIARPSL